MRRFGAGLRLAVFEVNGEPAVLALAGEAAIGVLIPEITDGRFRMLRIISNPEKLKFLTRQVAHLSHSGCLAGS